MVVFEILTFYTPYFYFVVLKNTKYLITLRSKSLIGQIVISVPNNSLYKIKILGSL